MSAQTDHWAAIAHEYILPGFADNIFNATPAWDMFWQRRKTINGGLSIDWRFFYDEDEQGQTYSPYQSYLVKPMDYAKRASIGWSHMVFPMVLSKVEILMCHTDDDMFDLIDEKKALVQKSMRKTLSTGLFGSGVDYAHPVFPGRTFQPMDGLELIVATDRTYAGFNSETYTDLDAYVTSNGAADLNELRDATDADYIGHDMEECVSETDDGDDAIDFWVGTSIMTSALNQSALETFYRDPNLSTDTSLGKKVTHFMGAPVHKDRHCTATMMYGLNFNHIQLITLKGADLDFENFQEDSSSDGIIANFKISCNIKCDEPRKQAKVVAASVTTR